MKIMTLPRCSEFLLGLVAQKITISDVTLWYCLYRVIICKAKSFRVFEKLGILSPEQKLKLRTPKNLFSKKMHFNKSIYHHLTGKES